MHTGTVNYYNENAEKIAAAYHAADVNNLHRLLKRWLPRDGRILEIGCGCGREAVFMAGLGCEVVATDASGRMLNYAEEIVRSKTLSSKVSFFETGFPISKNHPLFQQNFDVVVAVAVVMHIPDHELFEFAYQVRALIKDRGQFICSFCSDITDKSDDQVLFINREPAEIRILFERLGFSLLFTETNPDGMGRERVWTTLVFSAEKSLFARPLDQIEAIINRDKKTATYKLALLRGLCDIAQTSYHHAKFLSEDRVSIPLGLIVEKWIYYYWPIVNSSLVLPEMRVGTRATGIAFRSALVDLASGFKTGGLDAFYALFHNGRLSDRQAGLLTQAINAISNVIVKGPVAYSGGSLDEIGRVFSAEGPTKIRHCCNPYELINGLGRIVFPAGLWREMCLLGHWISEAIVMRWAELSCEFAKYEVSVSDVLSRLIIRPEAERNVIHARRIYSKQSDLVCVWSGKSITASRFGVDHVIPFTLWHNNDLWNLMPTLQSVNNKKRDKIVDRETLYSSRDRIINYWRLTRQESPYRFSAEINRTLLVSDLHEDNWEILAFSSLCETVELVALQRGVERWHV